MTRVLRYHVRSCLLCVCLQIRHESEGWCDYVKCAGPDKIKRLLAILRQTLFMHTSWFLSAKYRLKAISCFLSNAMSFFFFGRRWITKFQTTLVNTYPHLSQSFNREWSLCGWWCCSWPAAVGHPVSVVTQPKWHSAVFPIRSQTAQPGTAPIQSSLSQEAHPACHTHLCVPDPVRSNTHLSTSTPSYPAWFLWWASSETQHCCVSSTRTSAWGTGQMCS